MAPPSLETHPNPVSHPRRDWHRICLSIERHERLLLYFFLTVLTVFSFAFASREPFTIDEYLVRITELSGSLRGVWHIQATAPISVDPPLYHFFGAYVLRIFGASELSTRLVPVLSYSLFSFLLYRLVRRFTDAYTALNALALCILCGSFTYAYQARQYTWILAFDCLALICWIRSTAAFASRRLSLLGLSASVAIVIGSHWLGFMILIPLAAGELVRDWQQRRIDFAVWGSLAVAASTVMFYLPLLKAASAYRAFPWKSVSPSDISGSYLPILQPCIFPMAVSLAILALAVYLVRPRTPRVKADRIPAAVLVCLALFALFPFLIFVVAKLITHAFQPRYALPCVIGLIPFVVFSIRDFVRRSAVLILLLFVILGGYALFSRYRQLSALPAGGDDAAFTNADIFSDDPNLPIVPNSDDLFVRLESHAPLAIRQRCIFLTDPSSIRLSHQNTNYLMTEGLCRWTELPIVEMPAFLRSHSKFYLLQEQGAAGWQIAWLFEHHATMELKGTYAGYDVYEVEVHP